MSVIPSSSLPRLKTVARVQYGLGQPPPLSEEGIPIIRATNINRGRITRAGLVFARLQDLPLERAPLLQPGEILVVRSGAYTGDSALIRREWAGSAPGYDLRITPTHAYPPFLAFVLLSTFAQDQIQLARSRAAQPHLNAEDLGELRLWLPELSAQRATADYVDAQTARIDGFIEKKQRLIELLDEREQSVIAAAFEERSSAGDDFRMVRLGSVARIQTGLTLDAGRTVGESCVTSPYLRVANVQDGRLDLAELKEVTVPRAIANRCSLRPGDVLMTEGGDPDKLGRGTVWPGKIADCLHQNHVFAVRPDHYLLPEYLALITRTSRARAYFEMTAAKTTGIASTSTSKIASFRFPLPSLVAQRVTLATISDNVGRIAELREQVRTQIDLLVEHRQALITAAVTGELGIPGVAA